MQSRNAGVLGVLLCTGFTYLYRVQLLRLDKQGFAIRQTDTSIPRNLNNIWALLVAWQFSTKKKNEKQKKYAKKKNEKQKKYVFAFFCSKKQTNGK
jgi:hypothetical protein